MYHHSVILPIFHIFNLIFLSIKKQTNENIINRYMKIKMLFDIIQLLLSWGTHLNILHITSSYWSFYFLKYAMKCEPHGTLNLNTKNVEQLGM